MINQKSKTLRDFVLRITDKKGNKFIIHYGYDMSNKHSGHYLKASINGSDTNSNIGTLNKVKSLRIPAITQLIDAIGRDVTGTPENYTEEATKLLSALESNPNDKNLGNLVDFYQAYTENEQKVLLAFIEKYTEASPRAREGVLSRYLKTRRVTLITNQKALIKALRVLYMKGAEINETTYMPKICGHLDKNPYSHYYKRDIDYIRKARVNLYSKVLKREYVSVN